MFRNTVLVIVFSFAIGLVGCRACWGPYDHCQPTFVPEAGDQCMGDLYRNGSILGGMQRRGDCCGGCSACAGGTSEAEYYEGQSNYGFEPEGDYGEYNNANAEPLPGADGAAQPLPNTPPAANVPAGTEGQAPANSETIQDYLPDSLKPANMGI